MHVQFCNWHTNVMLCLECILLNRWGRGLSLFKGSSSLMMLFNFSTFLVLFCLIKVSFPEECVLKPPIVSMNLSVFYLSFYQILLYLPGGFRLRIFISFWRIAKKCLHLKVQMSALRDIYILSSALIFKNIFLVYHFLSLWLYVIWFGSRSYK